MLARLLLARPPALRSLPPSCKLTPPLLAPLGRASL